MPKRKKSAANLKSHKPLVPYYLLGLYGCGGGGGGGSESSNGTSQATISTIQIMGTVVKGPLYNAQVFLDYNGDGAWSEGEPTTYTSPNGTFSLTATDKTAQIIALTTPQTIDASSGTSLGNATLKAEAGSSVITPVTTMIVETNLTSSRLSEDSYILRSFTRHQIQTSGCE